MLATQLLWAVGGLALLTAGAIDRGVGWALVGAVVAGVSATVALRRGPRMILLSLAAIAVLAAAVALYGDLHGLGRVVFFVGVSAAMRALVALGERLGLAARAQLFAVVHVLSLLVAALLATHEMHLGAMGTALVFGGAWAWARAFAHTRQSRALAVVAHLVGVPAVLSLLALKHDGSDVWLAALLPAMAVFEAALARRRGDAASEEVAIVVAGWALWVLGYFVAAEVDATGRVSPFDLFVVGTVTWTLTVALALWRRRPIVSGASPVHLGAGALFLGEHLSSGTYYGRSIYFAGVAITFAVLALTVFRGRQWLQASHVVGALVAAAVSSACSLALIPGSAWDTSQLFGAAFAYAPSLGLIALRFDRATASRTAGSVGIAVLALLPSVELLLRPSSRALGAVAAVTGFALLAVALYVRSEDDVERLSLIRTPSAHGHLLRIATIAALLPAVVAAFYVAGRPLAAVLPFVVLVVLPAAAAFGLGLAAEPTRSRAARALQLAAATVFLGAFSLFSTAASRDYGHPALLLVGGAALLFFATMRRHRPIVLMSTAALVLGFWTQFFAKLHDKAPLSVLLIIFGVSLLAIGVLYETRLKRIVDNVRSWPGI
ncbi:MAG: hypothetical protein IT383_14585 [Deltaproteobacteria bacterium]|nr:hypothetical protein [Deltaproteobacteria bacterium]